MVGIYKILCVKNGQYYIGSSKDIKARWECHLSHLRRGVHHSAYLQNSYNKYGETSLEFSIILELNKYNEQELRDLEYYYINKLNPAFNSAAPQICECSEEWRTKISDSITELFKNKTKHPRYHKGKLYNVYDITGKLLFKDLSIQEVGTKLNASYHTFNNMIKKYDGICCSVVHSCLIMENSKTFLDLLYAYKNTTFNNKCSICDLDGNLYKRGNNYVYKGSPHRGKGLTFKSLYKQIINTENLYITIDSKTYTLPFLCHFVQQCISNNT